MITDEVIGARIRDLRGGMSQSELAAAIDMDPTILNKIEAGKRRIAIYEAVEVAEALGVTTDEILRSEEPMFVMRASDGIDVERAQSACRELAENYLHLQRLVGK